MSSYLRKIAVLGPGGVISPGSQQDYRYYSNAARFADTNTPWVRLWADGPSLWPADGVADTARWAALDQQIAQARTDGLSIILTSYRWPRWLNGTAGLTPANEGQTGATLRQGKSYEFRFPDDTTMTGRWAAWINTLIARYSKNSPSRPSPNAWINFLEIVNEPANQCWPQRSDDGQYEVVSCRVARMMQTAHQIAANYGYEPLLMAPGAADIDRGPSDYSVTDYSEFTGNTLDQLASIGFPGGTNWVWTVHNYKDIRYGVNRVQGVRSILAGRWAGWPSADVNNPWVWITEGGANLAWSTLATQGPLISSAWNRMVSDGSSGVGVGSVRSSV